MKLILILILFIVALPSNEGSWILNNPIVSAVAKKTHQMTDYVSEKGRNLKQYYDTMWDEINIYFDMDEEGNALAMANYNNNMFSKEESEITTEKSFQTTKKLLNLDDASIHMTTPQLLAFNNFPSESHTIVTEDGYILTLHRIPYSKYSYHKRSPKKTILLHHGLLGSSADWIIPGPEKGLGYILSNAGYDVWMANVRGNTYSKLHISRSIDSYSFWNFTFHEVSQYDLPAVIDYITTVKGPDVKINYVGFSMGSTALFALLSTKTQYNTVLNAGFALAPVAYMDNVRSPIRLLVRYNNKIEYVMKIFGANAFLPTNSALRWLSKYAFKHEIGAVKGIISKNLFFILCGYDEKQFNTSLVPAILDHVPAGTSTKTLVHYAQEISARKFQQFDYGVNENLKQYGAEVPPEYAVAKITLPIALISANNDLISSNADVKRLQSELPNVIEHYKVPFKEFNHIDFIWGVDAPTLVFDKLLQLLALVD